MIVRDPSKLDPGVRDRVEIVQGSSDDASVVGRACAGAESLFLVVPPSFTTEDNVEHYMSFTRPVIEAVAKGLKRVVGVSALGRGSSMKAGPVSATFVKDEALEKSRVAYRALWCPGFMDNALRFVQSVKHQGAFYWPLPATEKNPYASTGDIATMGVKLLLDRTWTGSGGVAVLGPENISLNDQASVLASVVGKPVQYQQISLEAFQESMVSHGASRYFAASLAEMCAAKANGLDLLEKRTPENTTPTTFKEWAETAFRAAYTKG